MVVPICQRRPRNCRCRVGTCSLLLITRVRWQEQITSETCFGSTKAARRNGGMTRACTGKRSISVGRPPGTSFALPRAPSRLKAMCPPWCLRNVGMLLEKDYGERVWRVNNVSLRVTLSRFRDRGHSLHVMSCYWESCAPEILAASLNREAASPFRTAMRAFRMRERGRCEKRVIKMGVWDSEEQDAEELLRQALARFIHPA